MGVMKCDRTGCEDILCERCSQTYGYICDDCFDELQSSRMDIATFMATNKNMKPCYDYEEEFAKND